MRKLLPFLAVLIWLAWPPSAKAQLSYPNDGFGGWTGVGAPTATHPHQQSATCSQTTTTITCTVTDGTKFAVNEPMMIQGTGTTMDWVDNPTDPQRGASIIATCAVDANGHCTSNTITLTAPASHSVGSTSGLIHPERPFVATTAGGGGVGPKIFTPLGNWIFFENITACASVANCGAGTMNGVGTKYTTNCQAEQAEINLFTSIGFNGIGINSASHFRGSSDGDCLSNTPHLPSFQEQEWSLHSTTNLLAAMDQPMFSIVDARNSTYFPTDGCIDKGLLDYWAPRWTTYLNGADAGTSTQIATKWYRSPDIMGVVTDDNSTGAGPMFGYTNADFHSVAAGKQTCHASALVLISSPLFTWVATNTSGYGGGIQGPYVFADPLNYTKSSGTPPATCALTTPCRLQDYLSKLYSGTIANLNSAWGSGANYTTFGSSGKSIGYGTAVTNAIGYTGTVTATPEAFATGNGATTSFSGTVANAPVSRCSMQIILTPSGGSALAIGGSSCAATTGVIGGPNNFQGSTPYPLNGILTDSNGSIEQVTTAGTTASSAPSWTTTIGNTTASGTATFTLRGSGITQASSSITWATGAVTIVTNNALQTGATLTLAYTSNAWGLGTGVMDEDGRNTGWMGTHYTACLVPKPAWAATHAYNVADIVSDATSNSWQFVTKAGTSAGSLPTFSTTQGATLTDSGGVSYVSIGLPVCGTSGDFPAPNMAAQEALDLDAWLGEIAFNYMNSEAAMMKARFPDMMNFGIDTPGAWANPAAIQVLQADQATGVDANSIQLYDTTFDPLGPAKYTEFTKYYTGPLVDSIFPSTAQSHYIQTCNFPQPMPCFATRQALGQWWYTKNNYNLNLKSYNGTYQWAGLNFEFSLDGIQGAGYGINSLLDNPFNGHDDVAGSVTCSSPNAAFSCGGESGAENYLGTDELTHAGCGLCIVDGNALWLTLPAPPGPAPIKAGVLLSAKQPASERVGRQ